MIDFLLAFNSKPNYVSILNRFSNITKYIGRKPPILTHPTCLWGPVALTKIACFGAQNV